MHIVVIPSWYKSDRNPYSGSFFEEQARALQAAGNEVRIFFPSLYPVSHLFKDKPKYDAVADDNGLITHAVVIQGIIPRAIKVNIRYLQWGADRLFKKYIRQHGKPDILHAHSVFDAGIIGSFFAQKYNIPLVLTEHLTHFTGSLAKHQFKKDIARSVFMSASQSIAVSRHFKNDLELAMGIDSRVFKVVYNMVANHFYDSYIPKKIQPGEPFVFFTNSFLNIRKNHTLQLDALKVLVEKGLDVKLVVGGAGEAEEHLKNYTRQLGLDQYVVFLGGLTRQRVKEEIDKSHAFLLSSTFESFGVVLIESIISGRPVISTDCGGPGEIVNEMNGYLVPSADTATYAGFMERMINNYALFNQEKMRQDCFSRFSEQTIAAELMEVYHGVIEKKNNSPVIRKKFNLRQQAATLSSWLYFLE